MHRVAIVDKYLLYSVALHITHLPDVAVVIAVGKAKSPQLYHLFALDSSCRQFDEFELDLGQLVLLVIRFTAVDAVEDRVKLHISLHSIAGQLLQVAEISCEVARPLPCHNLTFLEALLGSRASINNETYQND